MNSKKNIFVPALFFVLFIIASAPIYAQTENVMDRAAFGVKVGINSSNVYDSEGNDFDSKAKLGFATGIFISVPLGQVFGFQPEVMYSQKGYKGSGTILIADYTYTRKLNYIDIPLQLQIKPLPALTILAGPQYSFLVSKGTEVKSGDLGIGNQTDIDDDVRKNTLGIVGGLDFHMSNLVLSGRVAWDLQKNNGDGTSSSPRYKNVVMQLTLGLMF
jgi:hypothetical protein